MNFKSLYRKKPINVVLQQGGDGEEHSGLHKVLTARDLTFFGVAAIIGGGTFSAIGNACFNGGPGVVLLYIICAIACGFTAMCYAEFLCPEVHIPMLMYPLVNCLHGLSVGLC
jgi:amino acid permease